MTRILVVEDEPGIALGLEDDLKIEGYDVEVAKDGERRVAELEQLLGKKEVEIALLKNFLGRTA